MLAYVYRKSSKIVVEHLGNWHFFNPHGEKQSHQQNNTVQVTSHFVGKASEIARVATAEVIWVGQWIWKTGLLGSSITFKGTMNLSVHLFPTQLKTILRQIIPKMVINWHSLKKESNKVVLK